LRHIAVAGRCVTANVNAERFLQEKNEALETAARVKNDFIQNVSYQLRAPLQTVTMATAMLADGTMGTLNEKQKDYAESARQSADALLALMNDIFDLASLDAGAISLSMEDVTPEQEVVAVSAALADQLAKSGVTLVSDMSAPLGVFEADPQRVRQVLFHLVANAIGFSSPGQTITIHARRDGKHMVFAVSDKGRGIPVDVQARIFERFESHTEGSSHRGVGLGLSMVKAFMELHDGSVRLTSTPGEGTTVTCLFPLARDAGPQSDRNQEAA
jgi:signal transduction histidine kinase